MSDNMKFEMKRGDTLPSLTVDLVDSEGEYYDVENIDMVVFRLYDRNLVLLFEKAAIAVSSHTVRYDWSSDDTDLEPGIYYGEFEIQTTDGKSLTVPNNGWIEVQIR